MRTPTVTADWRISLGLAVAVIGGGAWWLSALHADVQGLKESAAKQDRVNEKMLEKLEVVAKLDTKMDAMGERMKRLERPVYQTNRKVDAVDERLARIFSPNVSLYQSPISQN
jgi:CII-binding regulator of phage lambda lysogenization HflD